MQGSQMLRPLLRIPLVVIASALALAPGLALVRAAEPATDSRWFDPAGIGGSLVLCGGGRLPDRVLIVPRQR